MPQNNLETLNNTPLKFDDVFDYLKHRLSEDELMTIITEFERRYNAG